MDQIGMAERFWIILFQTAGASAALLKGFDRISGRSTLRRFR